MSRKVLVSLACAGLLVLPLAGCSDSGGDGKPKDPETKARAALTSLLTGSATAPEQTRVGACLADEIVAGAGVDRLVEAGVLTKELTAPEDASPSLGGPLAETYVDALLACRDVKAEFAARKHLYPDLTAKAEQRYIDCAGDIDAEVLRPALLAAITGDQDEPSQSARQTYVEALKKCERILGEPTTS
ncbi:hypothetical protein [Nocardioides daejeonensis]|uniref:hypothetical protein n=1 Tax=Nocardioides daejeonensis TaxID=1046556 RepID=UPI000D74ADC5|nr:hypothetical protein [Nocardioides daejeonensis]